jgi:hypothetical protein
MSGIVWYDDDIGLLMDKSSICPSGETRKRRRMR